MLLLRVSLPDVSTDFGKFPQRCVLQGIKILPSNVDLFNTKRYLSPKLFSCGINSTDLYSEVWNIREEVEVFIS